MALSTTKNSSRWKINECLMLRLTAFLLFIFSHCSYITAIGVGSNLTRRGGCIESEMLSLLALKEGIYKPPVNWLSTWRAGTDCCSWQGVGCDYTTGHIIKLNLRFPYDLFPDPSKLNYSLLGLMHLRHLDLSMNDFNAQPIPKFLGSLVKLEYLNLSNAGFGGNIPPHLGNLSSLHSLDLNFNYGLRVDNGLDWVSRMTSLVYLDMSNVNLSKAGDNWIHDINMLPSLSVLLLSETGLEKIPYSLPQANFTSLTMLDLSGNYFSSTTPNWLFNITTLLHLDIRSCQLSGGVQISEVFGDHSRLQHLDLGYNNIGGKIPETMGSLCKLNYLDLSNNMIGGRITGFVEELLRCVGGSNLQILYLGGNKLNGTIPTTIGQLLNLQELDLSSNSFVGNLTEAHFSNLSNLDRFRLSYNHLEMIFSPSWIPPFNASAIYMCSCHMGPRFPAWLRTQTRLETLCISEAGIAQNIPHWFWDIDITVLNVSYNQINGQLPPSLETIKYIILDLSSNSFDGQIPNLDPTDLEYIDLSNNSLSGPIPLTLANPIYTLFFSLSNNHLNGSIPPFYFYNFTYLEILDLSNNNFSGSFSDSIGSRLFLRSLHLRNNSLVGNIPGSLHHSKRLAVLDVGENKLSGKIPTWIGESLPLLRVLRLRSNSFSGNIPSQISFLTNLQVLDLAYNNLSGILSPSFWNFQAMVLPLKVNKPMFNLFFYQEKILLTTKGIEIMYTTVLSLVVSIDLSNNGLCGEINEELSKLHGLQFLNLSKNHFTGKIPENIGAMRQLQSLDLSVNNLSGNIPPSISNLNFLEHLNLSQNNLSGRIPSGAQLQSLDDPSIYSGNLNLCGWPLQQCLVDEPSQGPSIGGGGKDVQGHDTDKIWLYASTAVGFIIGFWSIIGTLMIKVSLRISFFHIIDRFYDWAYVKLAISIARIKSYGEV